jgi:hypothetical protein
MNPDSRQSAARPERSATRYGWNIAAAIGVVSIMAFALSGVLEFSRASCMWSFLYMVSCDVRLHFAPPVPLMLVVGILSLIWLWKDRNTKRRRAAGAVAALILLVVATTVFVSRVAGGIG